MRASSLLSGLLPLTLAALSLGSPGVAHANRSVGLGVGFGVGIPTGDRDFEVTEAWGFYTDIPLISTFHITPSTLIYRLVPKGLGPDLSATDVSLNFKFMIPLGILELFAGITAGVTSTSELDFHVGGLAGAAFNIVSNLDVFLNVNYKVIFLDVVEVHDIQVVAGPLFRFQV